MPRTRKVCPICEKKGLLKLSNHLANVHKLFSEINITNFGRTIAYLICVYLQSEDEETVRRNVRRCVEELRSFDIPNLKQSNQRPILITLSLALIAIYVNL